MAPQKIEGHGWRLIFVPGIMTNYFRYDRCGDVRVYREGSNNFKKGQRIEGHFLDGDGEAIELEVLEDTLVCAAKDLPPALRNLWGQPARQRTSLRQLVEFMQAAYYPNLDRNSMIAFNVLRLASEHGGLVYLDFPEDLREKTQDAQFQNEA